MSLDYVMIGSNDLDRSRIFYDAVFGAIGGRVDAHFPGITTSYRFRNGTRAWVARPYDRQAAVAGNGSMAGYACASEAEVIAAHAAALSNGGTNEGDPGPRPLYGPAFFGGYVRDPDGNKMCFVFNRPDH